VTSLTHAESHDVVQQNESAAHTDAAHELQVWSSAVPLVHSLWLQAPPPPPQVVPQ
jgi:hypothetical protein